MSKKKKISNQNYMDFIVVKNPEIEYETNNKGQVTVMIEWRGFYHRIAQRFFKRPKVSAIKLDDYGSFLWQSINDQKTVHQLSETAAGLIQPALFKGCLQNSESSEKTKTTVTSGIRRSSQRSVRKTAIFQ